MLYFEARIVSVGLKIQLFDFFCIRRFIDFWIVLFFFITVILNSKYLYINYYLLFNNYFFLSLISFLNYLFSGYKSVFSEMVMINRSFYNSLLRILYFCQRSVGLPRSKIWIYHIQHSEKSKRPNLMQGRILKTTGLL